MNLKQFIAELTEQGVNLWAEGEQLRVRAAQGVITPDLRDKLALHKAELVKLLQKKSNANDTSIPQVPVSLRRNLPLSFAQEGLWFLSQLEPNNPFYNEALALRLHGSLNIVALEKSLNKIIQRHVVLRTNFAMVEGQLFQVIAESLTLSVQVLDLGELPENDREIAWGRKAMAQIQQPFDLSSSGLIQASVLKLTETEHVLLLKIHHIVCDAPSGGLLVRELAAFYTAYCNDLQRELPELPIQYADFAVWQRQRLQGDVLESQLAYWKQQLSGAPALLELPTDRVRPSTQTFRGARYRQALSKELTEALMILSRRQKVTLFMTLLAALKTLLYRYTGQSDICVGTPYASRDYPEIEGLIGLFVNTLVLRTDISGNPSFEELLLRVREVALGAYAHQDLPFEKLVEQLQPERSLSYTPLCQVMLNLYPPISQIDMEGLTVSRVAVETGTAKFDLSLAFFNTDKGLIGDWEYNTDLFDASTIARMSRHFQTLLEGIVANPQQKVSSLPLLTAQERHQLLVEWSNTTKEYPQDKFIHQLFEEQVERSPDAIAVVFEGEQLTYRELNRRANCLAHHLKTLSVGPEVLVGICVERSSEMVVGLLGILKAGGAYVPLDPTYPTDRLRHILEDAGVQVLLIQARLVESLPKHNARVVCLDTNWEQIAIESDSNPINGVTRDNLAYVIYTSGSTGRPKGVAIEHHSTVALLTWAKEVLATEEIAGVLASTSICFDLSVFELFVPLSWGGQVILAQNALDLPTLPAAAQVTLINTVPTAMAELVRSQSIPASVRIVNLAGEPLQNQLVQQIYQCPNVQQVFNLYGPSEDTTYSTFTFVKKGDSIVTIGRPIANTQVYLLDEKLQPVPIGVPGELYIGGDGLARGYLNRLDLTVEKFIPNPWSNESGSRLYKTGDLARYLPDGNIEFKGRIDNQVKIRGFRIELGEIEAILTQHPEVNQAVVVVHEDQPGNKRLVGYIVPRGEWNLKEDLTHKIKTYLRQQLPEYMVPATLMILSALPLTPNGKVDRRALPTPNSVVRSLALEMPQNKVEKLIANVWQKILILEKVGRDDNFFDLGGNSLRLVQVREELKTIFSKELSMVEMFQHPTVRALGQYLSEQELQTPDALKSEAERAELRNSSQGSMNQRRNSGNSIGRRKNSKLETLEMIHHPKNDIRESDLAIIAMSGRFPGAKNIDAFWENLRSGVESVSWFSDEELLMNGVHPERLQNPNYVKASACVDDIELFDANFFGFNPKDAEILDPQQRLFLECAWETLEQAGYNPQTYTRSIGVYAGVSASDYQLKNLYLNPAVSGTVSRYQLMLATEKDFLPTRVAYKLNLTGPAVNIQTACSTSLVAVHMACQSLLNDECDMALAGGVSISIPQKEGYLYLEGMILSPDGHCRAFDAKAQGTIGGDGVGVVMLKRATDALADGDYIHAIIKGSAINNDGTNKVGFTAPSVEGQAAVIGEAQAIAGIDAETITYIEAHGTGTELGDPIEIAALTKAFHNSTQKKHFCAIGSVKTNIGHLDTAAGVAGLIKTVLALKHQQIPPSLHFEIPNPKIDFANSPFYVNTKLSEWKTNGAPRRAGVSSFGIGGTNAHVVLEEAPVLEQRTFDETHSTRPYQLLVLSAKTSSALEKATSNLSKHLTQHPNLDLADVAYTLSVGRRAFAHRCILVCSQLGEAVTALSSQAGEQVVTDYAPSSECPVIFMFSGQGAQYVNMARDIYQNEAVFREQVDYCAELLRPELGLDLRDILYPDSDFTDEAAQQLQQTAIAQPALFTIEYALAKLIESWGVRPQSFIGHSIGEYVAACLAGVFSLKDALCLVAARGRMMQQVSGGAMLAIPLPEQEVQPLLGKELSIAAINGPSLCVVSGLKEAVEVLENQLAQQGIECRRLHTSGAFHSQMMEPILKPFAERVKLVNLNPPQIPYLSNVTGNWITQAQATDPDYWARHLRCTVQFALSMEELLKEPDQILLEVGPGRTLSTLVKRHPNKVASQVVLTSTHHLQQPGSDVAFLLNTLGQLWLAGGKVDWSGFYAQEPRYRVPLPTYPFERQRYWISPQKQVDSIGVEQEKLDVASAPGKKPDIADWFYIPSWKRSPLLAHQLDETSILGNVLVFTDECGLGEKLVQRLAQEGHPVVVVKVGESFIKQSDYLYILNPGQSNDYDTLLSGLRTLNLLPNSIIHLWSVTQKGCAELNLESVDKAQDCGFYSLLYLAQALGKQNFTDECQLTIVSNNMQEVAGEEWLCPEKATLIGPVKVIPQEYSNITCRSVDIVIPQSTRKKEILLEQLLHELKAKSEDSVIAYRGNHRFVQTYDPVRLEQSGNEISRLREGGVYLITGGLGGIGLVLAEHLANTVRAKLILTGRSAFPNRSEWKQWLATHDEQDEISRKIRKLEELKAKGTEVLIVCADLASRSQMQAAIAKATDSFGKINGVIHAAGVPAGGVVQLKTLEMALGTFAPKVKGTLVLDSIVKDMQLDWFILCSSLTSVLGGFGQVDYCAANAFLDSFAHYKTNRDSTRTVSINWDTWQEVGMAVEAAKLWASGTKFSPTRLTEETASFSEKSFGTTTPTPLFEQLLEHGLLPADGVEVFHRILCNSIPQVLVSTQDLEIAIKPAKGNTRLKQRQDLEESVDSQSRSPRPALTNAYVAPRNELEQTIAQIWQDFLGIELIGIYDNFFELGGDSLLGIQLTFKLSETLQEKISLNSFLNALTIAALAELIDKAELVKLLQKKSNAIDTFIPQVPVSLQRNLPLSFAQEGLWFLSQLEPNNPFYNEAVARRLHGSLNVVALEKSLNKIIQRHEILRTYFATVDGQPIQVIAESLTLIMPLVDLQYLPSSEREISVQRFATAEAQRPFDLASVPLIRVTLLKLTEIEHVLLLTIHHIVSDGWSWDIIVRELATIYSAFCNDLSPELPELSIQYKDFAVWQRQWLTLEVLSSQLAYWKQQLEGAPALLELPTDRVRPSIQTYRGAHQRMALSTELTLALVSLSQRQKVTLFMTLLAAFQTLLYRYTGQTDICVGTPHANRSRSEIGSLIGFFVNILVLRNGLSGNPSFEDVLSRVRDVTLLAHAHQDLPFEKLVEELKLERDLSYTPLVQVMLVFDGSMPQTQMEGLTVSPLAVETTTAKFDLTLYLGNTPQGLIGTWEYNTDLFDASTIARMAGHFQTLLEGIVANPQQRVSQLPLLKEVERHQLLVEWNNTQTEYPQDKCIHQLFEEQVERSPDAIAVVFEGEQLTYKELNQRAKTIAHHLRTLGVGPEVLVGICVERSLYMVVGLLGILKAGGAYVPLDPAYPTERLAYMLNDAQVKVLLTQEKFFALLGQIDVPVLSLDISWGTISQESQENPVSDVKPENLAYVIYTSGSTGNPKGVLINHHNVVRLFTATKSWFNFSDRDVWTLFHSYAFDFSVWEIVGALIYGGKLVVVPYWVSREPEAFYKLLCQEKVTVLNQTPSAFRQLIKAEQSKETAANLNLRLVIFGGEALELQSLKPWFERHGDQLPQLVNMYGITETTVHVTYRPLTRADLNIGGSMIGSPIPDLQVYILDQNLQPVPIGVKGEIHVGGAGLARGYLNRPDLSASKFIPNPFSYKQGSRLYKTGDKARYLPDGNIEFLDRIDNQVKIRGFRIELGEIEAVLTTHPEVREVVVIDREDTPGNKRLVAYIVAQEQSPIKNQLRDFLKQKLPDYMVPSVFVFLDALPLTSNGKVDRRALPTPDSSPSDSSSFVPPRDTVEQQLQHIWSEVLQLSTIGVHDNFFELGGHSLLAVRLMAQIQQHFSLNLPLATLLASPTIEQLASCLRASADSFSWFPLVAIQSRGDKRPFFCVPGVGGNVIYLYELARHLGLDQPFYGFTAKGLDGESEPLIRVEDIAAYYIEAMQTLQPNGPYLLGGHSFGGVVAFEMAQQLRKMGHEVALVAIIDTIAPIVGNKPNCSDEEEAANLFDFASYIEYMFSWNLEVSKETLANLTTSERLHYLKERLIRVNLLPPDAGITLVRGLVQVYMASLKAHRTYLPKGVLPIRIALFRTQDVDIVEDTDAVQSEMLKEPTLGWKEISSTVDVHVVLGNHMTMMQKPHVQVLAAQLQVALEQAQTYLAGL